MAAGFHVAVARADRRRGGPAAPARPGIDRGRAERRGVPERPAASAWPARELDGRGLRRPDPPARAAQRRRPGPRPGRHGGSRCRRARPGAGDDVTAVDTTEAIAHRRRAGRGPGRGRPGAGPPVRRRRHHVVRGAAVAAHGRHVAVEFVHPVIVGKRALPAVQRRGRRTWPTPLRLLARPGDVLLVVSTADDPATADLLRAGRGLGPHQDLARGRAPAAGRAGRARRLAGRRRPGRWRPGRATWCCSTTCCGS